MKKDLRYGHVRCMCKEQYEVFSDFVIAKIEHVEVVIPYLTCSSLDQGFLTVLELWSVSLGNKIFSGKEERVRIVCA